MCSLPPLNRRVVGTGGREQVIAVVAEALGWRSTIRLVSDDRRDGVAAPVVLVLGRPEVAMLVLSGPRVAQPVAAGTSAEGGSLHAAV